MSENLLEKYAKSFNWAGFFLPSKEYEKSLIVYNFCRTLDDIADENRNFNISKEILRDKKTGWRTKTDFDPITTNMWKLLEKENISRKIVEDLFDGLESDLSEKVKIKTKKDLLIYSYRVAGTVGLMMAKILKINKKNSLKSAIDLGIAMQLTNISRDVVDDFKNNRFYIDKNFNAISSTITLSETFYKNSFYSIKDIPLNFRFSILVARRVYRKIGRKILNKKNLENYQNSRKIYVSNIEKLLETFLSIFDLIRLSLTVKNEDQIQHDHVLINEEINLDERI